jgi:phospholipid/cholesterol/gamma-HCH transport system substrate-binding protein
VKISNETKIGVLTAIAITFLILGFNFLKGKNLFKTGNFLYAKYTDTKKLMPSNPVFINGYQIGNVYEIDASDTRLTNIVVSIKMSDAYKIPDNSVAQIESSPLGTPSITIIPGSSTVYLKQNDTIRTKNSGSFFGDISTKLAPVADQLTATLSSLDTVLRNFNTVLDPSTKSSLQNTIGNLNKATASILISTASLQAMLNQQSGALAGVLKNMDSFSSNLAANNQRISSTMSNIEKTTENLSKADIDGAVNSLKSSVEKLDNIMNKINSTDGTLGSLINDKELYNNIQNSIRSINTLTDDLRVHPKRYVNISVFGKKDKGDYLTEPVADTASQTHKDSTSQTHK